MSTIFKTVRQGMLMFFALIIISCGGGGGGSSIDGTGGPPQSRDNSVFIGTVSNENDTLTVNGVEFNSNEAEIVIDGEVVGNGDTSLLSTGQIVVISGILNDNNATATASSIRYNSNIRGPISSINSTDGTLAVLGQTIIINDDIRYGGLATSQDDLQVDDVIQVSGFARANNDLAATRIDKLNSTNFEVTGNISGLNTANNTFNINELVIDYGRIGLPLGSENGSLVEVQGSEFNNDDHLIATAINATTAPFSDDIDIIQLEGLITDFTDEFNFSISDLDIETNRQTVYVGGTAAELTLNSNIEVEGTLTDNGIVMAERIIFLTAAVTNFNRGDRINSTTETFTWRDMGADEYRLRIVSIAGIGDRIIPHDEYYTGDTLSAVVTGLPKSDALFDVVLSTRHGQWWSQRTVRLRGQGLHALADLTSHSGGDVLESETVTFTWSDVDADEYRFLINNNGSRLFDESVDGNTLSVTVENLPINRAYLAPILMARHGRWWSAQDYRLYSYDALQNASLTSHENNAQLAGGSETFTWEDVGADGYELSVVSSGRVHFSQRFDGNTNSFTVSNLPFNNAIVDVGLHTNHGGFWNKRDYRLYGSGALADAELTSHENLERLEMTDTVLAWTEISDAEQYRITVRAVHSDGGDRRIIHSDDYDTQITSLPLENLPRNGALFDVLISTQQEGWWGLRSYRLIGLQALDNALLTSHIDGDIITSDSVTINWSDVDADQYLVHAYTSSGVQLQRQLYDGQTTSANIAGLPRDGSTLYIHLTTNHEGWWAEPRGRYRLISD